MTIPRWEAVSAHWDRVPPLSVSVATVAASLGVPVGKQAPKENNIQDLVDMMGAAGLSTEKPAWLTT